MGRHQGLDPERHGQIAVDVAEFVGTDDYVIDKEVELLLDAKKRGYPKTIEERDLLLRKLVHFQMSNYISSATTTPPNTITDSHCVSAAAAMNLC